MLAHFVREERGVNAAEHDERATHAGASRHRVSTQGIGSMNADAHHVAVGAKAANPSAARLFTNYLISQDGLKALASEGEFVLVRGLYPPIKDAEKLEIRIMDDLTDAELKKWRGEFKKIFF